MKITSDESFNFMQMKVIFITMVLLLDSFKNRGTRDSEIGTLRYGDYGLRTTVGRKLSCCVVLGRVHNEWRENTKLRSHTTHTGLRTSARCNNTAACLCFFILPSKCLLSRFKMLWFTH